MNSKLFDCPDCKYQCSMSALSCLNCGRIFRVSQTNFAPPRTSPQIVWIIVFSTTSLAVLLTIGLIMNTNWRSVEPGGAENGAERAADQTAVEARREFALRVQAKALENSNKPATDLMYTTEDYLEKSDTLVVTGSALTKKECDVLVNGDDGRTAAELGFNRVNCRNRRLGSEWWLQLEKTNF